MCCLLLDGPVKHYLANTPIIAAAIKGVSYNLDPAIILITNNTWIGRPFNPSTIAIAVHTYHVLLEFEGRRRAQP